jgi:hypothetical protein
MGVKCYIEEYITESGRPGVRVREKETGRKVEITAFTAREHDDFLAFLNSPNLTGMAELLTNLYEPTGDDDHVIVDGYVEADTPEVIRFTYDSTLSYLFG